MCFSINTLLKQKLVEVLTIVQRLKVSLAVTNVSLILYGVKVNCNSEIQFVFMLLQFDIPCLDVSHPPQTY